MTVKTITLLKIQIAQAKHDCYMALMEANRQLEIARELQWKVEGLEEELKKVEIAEEGNPNV